MLLTDVQTYGSDVLHLSISTKTYWWHQLLSNGGNIFVHLIIVDMLSNMLRYKRKEYWVFWKSFSTLQ